MIKKIGFWLLIVLFVLGLVFGYWYLSVSKQHESAAIFNLPDSCAFIIESRDFSSLLKKLNETSLLWQELQKNKLEPESIINLKLLDSILEATDDPEAYINEKSISLVAYNEHNQFNFLLAFHTSAKGLEIWQKLLKKTGGKLEKEIAKKSLRSIFKYSPTNGSKSYYGYLNKNTIWVCEDKNLLDNCMTAEKTLQKNKDFNKVIEFAGNKNDCRIFLNLNKTHSFLQADIGNYMNSGWIELDADIKPAEFSLNGIIKSDSSSLYKELIKQEPQDIEFIQHIPEQTINFTFFGFSDYSSFYNNFYLTNNKQQNDSLSGKISRMVGNEIVLLETEIKNGKRRKYVQLRIQEIEIGRAHV